MLRLMIVDDDVHMRMALRKAVIAYDGFEVCGEAASGEEAVAIMESMSVDIAFMDVDMPGINGVETARLILDINPKCAIIFITAHDDYMSQAFELYAFDYIVKPFKIDRLHTTMDRLIQQKTQFLQNNRSPEIEVNDDLLLKVKDGMVVVKKEDVLLVERENRQTVIVTRRGEFIISKSLQEVEVMLGDKGFLRSHKSYIIRIDAVEALKVYGRWTYIVKFKGTKHDALITREKAKALTDMFRIVE